MWDSFVSIFFKEFVHIRRDKGTLMLSLMLPVFQLVLFGFIDQNVRDLPTVVVDQDQSVSTRDVMARMRATRTFAIESVTTNRHAARDEVISGRARAAVIIPPDFHKKRLEGHGAQMLVLIDGSDSTASSQVLAAVNGLASQMSLEATGVARLPAVSAQPIILFNPEGK